MAENDCLPKVSIVTPSYNQGKFIEKTIASVLSQRYLNIEYVVVDGLSTDETGSILERYQELIDTTIIEADQGQTDALNKGFKHCSGDIIAYLNSDDCYANSDVIATVVRYFNQHPNVDVLYGQRHWINEDGCFIRCDPYRPFSEQNFYLSDFIPQEGTFWRRSIFEKSGAYVDTEFEFAMDYELFLRFLKNGAKFLSVQEVLGLFRYYPSQKTTHLWHSKGLPEIAKLHHLYLGRQLEETEMINYNKEHFYGVNPGDFPEIFEFYQNLWHDVIVYRTNVLNHRPLDEWMFHMEGVHQIFSDRKAHKLLSK
ncbi:MAG: glycosyltransferase [Leptolyngbyaceae cyanobacterium CSU_1_3]|nr:glycosyltransferase [Leptolyngbyaceae cyanobacterium CSU_1_3]